MTSPKAKGGGGRLRQDRWRLHRAAVRGPGGAVAAQDHRAAEAGAQMLARGGNAVDAAVAGALALAAVEPWMCGLGGSGFFVAWLAGERRAVALDFQGTLARGLTVEDYPLDPDLPRTSMGFPAVRDLANTRGYAAITVPGAVPGLSLAAERHGRLGFGACLEPAITLAEAGLEVGWYTTLMIASEVAHLAADPVSSAIYLPGGAPPEPGARIEIPNLAATLRRLRDHGAEDFRSGALARDLVGDLREGGSRIAAEDLASYTVHEVAPIETRHRGARLFTPGPQSGGERLDDMLDHIAKALPSPRRGPEPASWVVYAEALETAWRRHREKNGTLAEVGASTSALAAMDADGNAVAITYTLLDHFGSGVTLPSLGICMNNGVSYFDPRPGRRTSMKPGARVNSSNMCPTVAVRDDRAIFAVGASGGDLIMPCVSQIAALMLDFGMTLEEAIHSPRLDASHRGSVRVDPELGDAVIEAIAARYSVEVAARTVMPKLYACPSAVARTADGAFEGISDPDLPQAGAAVPS